MNVDEAQEAVMSAARAFAVGYDSRYGTMPGTGAALREALDRYGLACHVEACSDTSGNGYWGPWSYCGGSYQRGKRGVRIELATPWYCSVATERWPKQTEAPAPAKQGR